MVNWHSFLLCLVGGSSRRPFHHVELFSGDWVIAGPGATFVDIVAAGWLTQSIRKVRHGELRLHLVVSKAIVPSGRWLLILRGLLGRFDSGDDRPHAVLPVDGHASIGCCSILPWSSTIS